MPLFFPFLFPLSKDCAQDVSPSSDTASPASGDASRSNMPLLQPIPIQAKRPMDDTFDRLGQTTTPAYFYHRVPPPSPEELRFFGLENANQALSKHVRCTICRGHCQDPVVTKCRHIFCFGCIYEWFGSSVSCPHCARDLYNTRKLRKQPSFDIHPADRDVPHRFSSTEWIRSTNSVTPKASNKSLRSTAETQKVLGTKKTRPPTSHLQVPKSAHQHSQSDRVASYQHRKVSFSPQSRKNRTKCGRYSLPGYGSPASDTKSGQPYQQYSLDMDYKEKPPVPEASPPEVLTQLDPGMVDLISTCTDYLQRERQAPEQKVRIMFVDSEDILAGMWAASIQMGQHVSVPIRCRAIAKCVWREWEYYLKRKDGSLITDEELFWDLHGSFEKTVVEYGWVQGWRELPEEFVDLLERTMAVATQV